MQSEIIRQLCYLVISSNKVWILSHCASLELNKKILEVLMAQPNGALHELVLQALNFEAKKIMN